MEWQQSSAKWFEQKHGKEVMREVLINYVITNGNRASEPLWKELCVRIGLCTKSTKYISLNMHHFNNTTGGGNYHMIRVMNGRGQYLINISVMDTELNQYLGE